MQLSTKARYAVRAMVELALHYGKGPQQLKEIARKQELSEKYLEQVLLPMRSAGYISTKQGSRGGYMLARPPAMVTAYDIIRTTEGPLAPAPCTINETTNCLRRDVCAAKDLWLSLQETITSKLQSITLRDLAEKQEKIQKSKD